MGLTPLEGLVMGTRSGDIDPAIMEFIAKKENLDIAGIMNVLNKKSGVEGVSGVSSDFRDLEAAAKAGNKRAELAIDVFAYRVAKYVGAYTAAMNGVDNIVFTAGIGENCALVRTKVCSYLGYLGITIDEEANGKRGEEIIISTPDSKVKVLSSDKRRSCNCKRDSCTCITEEIRKNLKICKSSLTKRIYMV